MSPIALTASAEVDRPAAVAWAVVADYRRDPEWRTGVLAMAPDPPGPVAAGTTTSEDIRVAGRTWHNEGVVTELAPGERVAWRTTSGADAEGSRAVAALGPDRCRVTLTLTVRPHGAERLLRPLAARQLRRTLARDLVRLDRLLAAETVGADA
jgi:uncharacterized membrane protein